jgi:predicted dienelactone hydrolase
MDVPQFGTAGPYAVGYRHFVLDDGAGQRTGAIWYPAVQPDGIVPTITYDLGAGELVSSGMNQLRGHSILDAEPYMGDAPYPLIVSSHGMTFSYYVSAYQFEHLASHGFVVYAFDHSTDAFRDLFATPERVMMERGIDGMVMRLLDISAAIDHVETMTASDGALSGLVDMERIGIHGLSYGGYVAVMETGVRFDFSDAENYCAETTSFTDVTEPVCDLYGEDIAGLEVRLAEIAGLDLTDGVLPSLADSRVDVAAAIVPGGGLSLIADPGLALGDKPLMMLVAGADQPLEDTALRVWDQTGSSIEAMAVFEDASHLFAAQCTRGMNANWSICVEPIWDPAQAHDLSNHFVTAFFRATLMDDSTAAAALAADAVNFPGITYQARGF